MTGTKSLDRSRGHAGTRRTTVRGQSHVVGVVLLLGLTTVALGGLTASIGVIIEDQTGHADASSVVADFDSALRPVETTGSRRGRVTFSEGTITSVSREIRILDDGGVVETVDADALAYSSGDRRVAFVGGAIVRGSAGSAWIERQPSVASGPDVLVVGAPRLNGTGSVGGTGGVTTALATNVSHARTPLGVGDYSVAIETETPAAFDQYVATRNATATTRDIDGDGVPSAVIDYRGDRTAYLVVHDMRLEVGHG